MADALFELMGAKGLRLTQNINGFKQTGFAGSIVPNDQIESSIEVERRAPQISEIRQTKLTDKHGGDRMSYRRIGITTYRLEASSLSLIIALLFASLSLICTLSELSTFNTSIK